MAMATPRERPWMCRNSILCPDSPAALFSASRCVPTPYTSSAQPYTPSAPSSTEVAGESEREKARRMARKDVCWKMVDAQLDKLTKEDEDPVNEEISALKARLADLRRQSRNYTDQKNVVSQEIGPQRKKNAELEELNNLVRKTILQKAIGDVVIDSPASSAK